MPPVGTVMRYCVADWHDRQLEADHAGDVIGVRAGGIDHRRAADPAPVGLDLGDGVALQENPGDPDAGREAGAGGAGAGLVGHGEVVGLQIAVARAPEDRLGRRRDQARPAGLGGGVVEQVHLEPGRPRGPDQALELLDARVLERDPEAADLAPGGPRLGTPLQRREGRDRIHRQPDPIGRVSHLADQPRRLRRGHRGERRLLLDQQDVALAGRSETIGDGAADRAAADDHDLRAAEFRHGHAAARMASTYQRRNPRTFCSRSGDSGPGW